MTNDKPPVAPIEGHYAMLRNGEVVGPIGPFKKLPYLFTARLPHMSWRKDGVSDWDDPDFDIIATISPEAMALAIHPDMDGAVKAIENLVKLADAACDYADAHCRAFPIATAPQDREIQVYNVMTGWYKTKLENNLWPMRGWSDMDGSWYPVPTHWTELPPPPTNPPLPAVFVELGQALEKIKGAS